MSKKYYRFFGGLLTAQEHWLNKMSEKGYRLIRAEKMLYEFEECKPDQSKILCGVYRAKIEGRRVRLSRVFSRGMG